ncbi:fumarylacetoacetase [Modestobacter sp. Leaf380]|uniref:fumarylacetoacetase n=1 Tax=Modestobacter sp. Leaf380 TaxID=1736356 RepID=UPI000B191DE4|nr:fumarylacetoacetase [Modestobacter sp. Leaf380]
MTDHHTLPFGVFSQTPDGERRVGVRVDDTVLDVSRLDLPHAADFASSSLNAFLARGRAHWDDVRARLQALLAAGTEHLLPAQGLTLHLPIEVADYVDFYSSRHHAENIGRMFRPDSPPLTPNWTHLPIGYHGRSGTVAVSGTPVVRPSGQRKAPTDDVPTFGPSRRLDIEAEVGFVVGTPSDLGTPVPIGDFAEHVFGVCLVNDWSSRDLQAWEYVPLGPFLGKSFLTSVSPWVVPLAALEAARVPAPPRDTPLLPYLDDAEHPWGLDLELTVSLNGEVVSSPPFGSMYWTAAQQLAHLTVNGASLRTGDLLASGTVSGPQRDQRGSFIELGWGGAEVLTLADGSTRSFLEDGDVVSISATAPGPGGTRISFGEVTGEVLPAR